MSKSKKDLSKGIDSVLGEGSTTNKAKPLQSETKKSTTKEVRATFIIDEGKLEKIKALAQTEGVLIKEVLDRVLGSSIQRWEAKHGKIKTVSKNKNIDERLKDL